MKKLLIAMPVALCIGLVSCSDKDKEGGMSDATKKNLESMHAVQKAFETKDFSKVGDYIAEDAVDHTMEGDIKGLAAIKANMEKMGAMTEGDKSEVIKELADDEYVMSWSRYSGKAKTADMGMKPGEKMEMSGIEVAKFKDGKAVEHWSMMEFKEAMKMMPPPGAEKTMDHPMPDTAKKMDAMKK